MIPINKQIHSWSNHGPLICPCAYSWNLLTKQLYQSSCMRGKYGAIIPSSTLIKAQLIVLRYILYGELGRYQITINFQTRMISFWNRLICTNSYHKLSKQMYNNMLNDINKQCKWLTFIMDILLKTGDGKSWVTHNHNKVKNIHLIIKQNLNDQLKQKSQETKQSQKGRNYNTFKTELNNILTLPVHSLFAFSNNTFRTYSEQPDTVYSSRLGAGMERHSCKTCKICTSNK